MSTLKKRYQEEIKETLFKKLNCANRMQIPYLKKVVISMGVAEAVKDKNVMQDAIEELSLISGQKPLVTCAKGSIAGFKLREGQEVGLKVTLRGVRMYDFCYRFFNIVCPRIRDFRGFKKKGDGRGSYSLGLSDQQMFPELNLDKVKRDQGMNITFVTSAADEEQCLELLTQLGLPYKREN